LKTRTKFTLLLFGLVLISGLFLATVDEVKAAPNLQIGSRGEAVVELQRTLNNNGYWCGSVDGIFGTKTYNAVIKFQKSVGIKIDGIVGPVTRKYLGLSESTGNSSASVSRSKKTITMVATGYCPCAKCNWPYVGQPSYLGYPLGRGIAAVDPKVIPMGSKLYVEGYGNAIAADQGEAIKGNRIDLCFSTHQQALNWGIKTVRVTILN